MLETIKTTTDLIQWFLKNESELVKKMSECDHNYDKDHPNNFHSEGSIFTHTMMVMKEADRNNLSIELKIACLLHDIGKHIVIEKVEETKRNRFFNHDSVSAFMSLDIMDKLQLNNKQKEHIFKLIALHTQPFKQDLNSLQKEINDYGLYYSLLKLSEADQNGRFHIGENINLDFNFLSPVQKIRQNSREVVLMVGLCYSGKSTYIAEQLQLDPNCIVISRDSLIDELEGTNYNDKWKKANQNEIDNKLKEKLKEANKNKTVSKVFVDMTHMSKKSRRKTLGYFGVGWDKSCVVMLPNMSTLDERMNLRLDKIIDSSVIHRMMMSFYPPLHGEGFHKIDYIVE